MKYALLIYRRPDDYAGLSADELAAVSAEYVALQGDDRVREGAALTPTETATTLRASEGRTLTTDGPFADTKEVFGGYYVVDAADLDEALELAGRIPALRMGGAVEVRPVLMAMNP